VKQATDYIKKNPDKVKQVAKALAPVFKKFLEEG